MYELIEGVKNFNLYDSVACLWTQFMYTDAGSALFIIFLVAMLLCLAYMFYNIIFDHPAYWRRVRRDLECQDKEVINKK